MADVDNRSVQLCALVLGAEPRQGERAPSREAMRNIPLVRDAAQMWQAHALTAADSVVSATCGKSYTAHIQQRAVRRPSHGARAHGAARKPTPRPPARRWRARWQQRAQPATLLVYISTLARTVKTAWNAGCTPHVPAPALTPRLSPQRFCCNLRCARTIVAQPRRSHHVRTVSHTSSKGTRLPAAPPARLCRLFALTPPADTRRLFRTR